MLVEEVVEEEVGEVEEECRESEWGRGAGSRRQDAGNLDGRRQENA